MRPATDGIDHLAQAGILNMDDGPGRRILTDGDVISALTAPGSTLDVDGECPLKHTRQVMLARAEVQGGVAFSVRQLKRRRVVW